MNDEIKELFRLLYADNLSFGGKRKLEKHITNLQEERDMYKVSFETMSKNYFEEKSKKDKAIEYIENDNNLWVPLGEDCGRPDKDLEELLNILRGDDNK